MYPTTTPHPWNPWGSTLGVGGGGEIGKNDYTRAEKVGSEVKNYAKADRSIPQRWKEKKQWTNRSSDSQVGIEKMILWTARTPDNKKHYATSYTHILHKIRIHLETHKNQDWTHMKGLPRKLTEEESREYLANRYNPLWWILNHQGVKISTGKQRLVAKMLREYSPISKEYSPPKESLELLRPLNWNPEGKSVPSSKPYTCPKCGRSNLVLNYDGKWLCPKCGAN